MDTSLAVLAGIAIFPAVFSFGEDAGQGPSLIFSTLPKVFKKSVRRRPGICHHLLHSGLFAAITSAIALLEVTASYVTQNWKWSRKKAVPAIGFSTFLLGVPSCLALAPSLGLPLPGTTFLTWLDF
ncbi:MAG: hypothetical protein ACLSB9_11330 [Hydrogeniiclostridium mannosilyticum]